MKEEEDPELDDSKIEQQRPSGERQMTTSQWLLYNILDLKYIQGKRVREVASQLAMSESDLYRKQRTAISEVARAITEMEANTDRQEVSVNETTG